jgi:hypothetical protein
LKGENPMMKKILVLVIIILLLALTIQVASADPTNPPPNDNGGSCNMGHSWWEGKPPKGEANGSPAVKEGESGMHNVHQGTNPHHGQQGPLGDPYPHDVAGDWYPKGATNMDTVTDAQCGG